MTTPERKPKCELIEKLRDLKYEHRSDIRDRASFEKNLREKIHALNHVKLTEVEFSAFWTKSSPPDVFTVVHTLPKRSFTRDGDTPLNFTHFNINDWSNNTFEIPKSSNYFQGRVPCPHPTH